MPRKLVRGQVPVQIMIDESLYKKLRVAAFQKEVSVNQLVKSIVEERFKKK